MPAALNLDHIILGGGSSHDFDRWFKSADLETLGQSAGLRRGYTDRPQDLLTAGDRWRILTLCTNQPLAEDVRAVIIDFVRQSGGLFVMHAGAWRNWGDWEEYHNLIGGGTSGHEPLREFEVEVLARDHPVTRDLPATFRIVDELYRFEAAGPIEVLAEGVSLVTGERYPVLWAMPHDTLGPVLGRVVGTTLGHDGRAHEHPAFKSLLRNGAGWLEQK